MISDDVARRYFMIIAYNKDKKQKRLINFLIRALCFSFFLFFILITVRSKDFFALSLVVILGIILIDFLVYNYGKKNQTIPLSPYMTKSNYLGTGAEDSEEQYKALIELLNKTTTLHNLKTTESEAIILTQKSIFEKIIKNHRAFLSLLISASSVWLIVMSISTRAYRGNNIDDFLIVGIIPVLMLNGAYWIYYFLKSEKIQEI